MSLTIRQIFMGVCSMLVIGGVAGQNKIVMGVVIDSATQTPLPKVSICVSGSTHCVLSDNAGKFKIAVDNSVKQILITATSYGRRFLQSIRNGVDGEKLQPAK